MNLESWLHYQIFGDVPPTKGRRKRKHNFRRGPARRWRYRQWIRSLPSAVSGLEGCCEAAHTGTDGGRGQKASDYSCIPLTAIEHAEYHQIGKKAFESKYKISCEAVVQKLNRTWFQYSNLVK